MHSPSILALLQQAGICWVRTILSLPTRGTQNEKTLQNDENVVRNSGEAELPSLEEEEVNPSTPLEGAAKVLSVPPTELGWVLWNSATSAVAEPEAPVTREIRSLWFSSQVCRKPTP